MGRCGLILDRDGVVNVDHGYVYQPAQIVFLDKIFELARRASVTNGWPLVIVTNQAGIGRGLYDERQFLSLMDWMCDQFVAAGARRPHVYYCPFHPERGQGRYLADHPWRKPAPGMIQAAIAELALDPARSVMIGDRASDMEAAKAAGIGCRLWLEPNTVDNKAATTRLADIDACLRWLETAGILPPASGQPSN